MKLIKPKKLKTGDTIALISPSSGLAALFPHRLDKSINFLKSEGYSIKEYPCTRNIKKWESAPAEKRAEDIMNAFVDKDIDAIICTIGGNTANKTLKYLNFDKIRKNPKVFCGYSDISVLHYAINKKSKLSTFYGPCAMTQFGENPKPLEHTIKYFKKAVVEDNLGEITPSKKWTDEVLDWGKKEDLKRKRGLKENDGYKFLREGETKGNIIGGCLPSISHLLGTEYWPDHSNKVLFLETPEGNSFDEGQPLPEVDSLIADLKIHGVFDKIKGLIIGRPFQYSEEQEEKFREVILDNTKSCSFPILYGADIGHTDPQITIPLGRRVYIESETKTLKFL